MNRVHFVYKKVLIIYASNDVGYGYWVDGGWDSVVDFLGGLI